MITRELGERLCQVGTGFVRVSHVTDYASQHEEGPVRSVSLVAGADPSGGFYMSDAGEVAVFGGSEGA